jgi:hypothetical protein
VNTSSLPVPLGGPYARLEPTLYLWHASPRCLCLGLLALGHWLGRGVRMKVPPCSKCSHPLPPDGRCPRCGHQDAPHGLSWQDYYQAELRFNQRSKDPIISLIIITLLIVIIALLSL